MSLLIRPESLASSSRNLSEKSIAYSLFWLLLVVAFASPPLLFRFLLRYVFFFCHYHAHALGRPDDLPGQSLQRQVPRVVVSLLDQRNVVDHFRGNVPRNFVRAVGSTRSLGHPRGPLDEPARGWGPDRKGVGPIRHGPQFDPERCFLFVNLSGLFVKVLAELGHVDSQRTEGLTDGWAGLGGWILCERKRTMLVRYKTSIAYTNSVRHHRSISHRFNDRKLHITYGTSNKIKTKINPTHPSTALANKRHERKTFFRTILCVIIEEVESIYNRVFCRITNYTNSCGCICRCDG